MTILMMAARAEAGQELSSSLLHTASDVMKRHGNDPHGPVILITGFFLAIERMGMIDPKIPIAIAEMLREKQPWSGPKEQSDTDMEKPLICPVTGQPCLTEKDEFCDDYGCARKAGIDVDNEL